MCRLFALVTPREESARPWLTTTERSLLAQSNVTPDTAQRDGWGIAWYDDAGAVYVQKGVGGAFEPSERPRYEEAAAGARGTIVVGHLRHASNPLGLPHAQLIALENSQPFTHGSWIFAHNGGIPFPTETQSLLGAYRGSVRGVNDSEVLFWLLQRHLDDLRDPVQAYVRTVEDLERVWEERGRPVKPMAYSGLNVILSHGPNELWAFDRYLGDHGTGLIDETRPYYEMTYRADPDRLLVASERLDPEHEAWRPLRNGHFLHARIAGSSVELRTGPMPLPALV